MERNGKKLNELGDGHPRRLSDGRNAFRKMNFAQRVEFVGWIVAEIGKDKLDDLIDLSGFDGEVRAEAIRKHLEGVR